MRSDLSLMSVPEILQGTAQALKPVHLPVLVYGVNLLGGKLDSPHVHFWTLKPMLCMACYAFGTCRWCGCVTSSLSVVPFLDVFSVALKLLDFFLEIGFVLLFLSSTVRVVYLRGRCVRWVHKLSLPIQELKREA